ncbi:imidazole glycerol phosphate synthase subunit HisH [Halopseudomonas laoshanensis]|uniref:Imidazole glycerol phosphate synthase subunit HisH n=1 Tax=Halopseudomonas laoshanensis TaxID=2268758 RepID=A0A7V7KUR2_9GAMM|nr:imidazole glycerol phosphate synthase subunit HisH [Halopseudomonas laoshanensis]KAA0690843.1 imidazole glycerol phosphate synthase subunit HisH [Halopseudomonas laoshanensis]
MIHIVDYGLGNTQAFVTMYRRLGVTTKRAQNAEDLRGATKLILPGVGAFDYAMELLNASGMRGVLEELVVKDGVPVLGICVGMQMLADLSEEGTAPGLGWVPAHVRGFASNSASASLPMPHMGWNDVKPAPGSPLFKDFDADARFYFLHSFYFDCLEKSHVSARADYGFNFDCAVQNRNVYGVQFHPEKSHHWGANLLKNFADI